MTIRTFAASLTNRYACVAMESRASPRRFERAIKCDQNCTEALRELRLMNMRKAKTNREKKGLFGKMFN